MYWRTIFYQSRYFLSSKSHDISPFHIRKLLLRPLKFFFNIIYFLTDNIVESLNLISSRLQLMRRVFESFFFFSYYLSGCKENEISINWFNLYSWDFNVCWRYTHKILKCLPYSTLVMWFMKSIFTRYF
jgi:hypothetical protein